MKTTTKIFFVIFTSFILNFGYSQSDSSYSTYNKRIINPFITAQHELVYDYVLAIDINPEDSESGNLKQGFNYGVGLGYNYRWIFDDPSITTKKFYSLGFTSRAEWFPERFVKFHAGFEFDILALGISENLFGVFLSGWEQMITFSSDFSQKEMFTVLYLFELNIKHFEIKWGLQSNYEKFMPNIFIDDAFNVIKISHQFFRR